MCHVSRTNESCHTYECVMSHVRMSHVTHTNEMLPSVAHVTRYITHMNASLCTYESDAAVRMLSWDISRYTCDMTHVTHTDESCHTYEWVMSQVWIGHVTHTNESCLTYEWVMSHVRMSHVTRTNEMLPSAWSVGPYLRVESDMTHDANTDKSCHTYEWVMSHVRMSHVTHTNESCHTYEWNAAVCMLSQHISRYHTPHTHIQRYGVASDSRIDKITGLFCRIWSHL